MTDVRHTRERIAGCEISIRRGGTGQPLLFLHGARGAGRWLPFMEELSQNFDVIVPEHPGYGQSETPGWLDNIHDLAYFYLDFLDYFGLRQVHLAGNSMGGWIAAELAVRDQHSLRSLTLVSPAGIHVHGVQPGDIFLWPNEELVRNLFASPRFAEAMLSEKPSQEEQDIQLKNKLTTAKLAWQPRLYDPHLAKWLHRITLPTLIVWGAQDKLIPEEYGPAFRNLIPHARLEIFTDCGHLPHVEKMAALISTLRSFLQGVQT
jgi:pimeloyl-ACP methyl ester carboxylesterase